VDERESVTNLYRTRKAEREATFAQLSRLDVRVSNARLALFGVGVLLVWLAFGRQILAAGWLLLPFVGFVALIIRHDRLLKQKTKAERAIAFYESGLARLEDRWMGRGISGDRFLHAAHPYALDLDLFGSGSLFELLCTVRTQFGEECLADWLRTPAESTVIRARQEAVRELASRLELREEVAILGASVRSGIRPETLTRWGNAPVALPVSAAIGIALGIAALSIAALVLWAVGYGLLPLFGMAIVGGIFDAVFGKQVRQVIRSSETSRKDLELFADMLALFERETFTSEHLQALQAAVKRDGIPPSVRITRLKTLFEYLEAQQNFLFAPLAFLLRWSFLFAYAIERWREKDGKYLALWLHTAGEFEALCALGGFAHQNPDSVYPEIVETGICYEAEEMAHPLLPVSHAVRNSLTFDPLRRLYIVSGSNMSGKSTLLRTVGTNAVLALMGSPVLASRFRIAPLSLAASIRTEDSLQAGVSRFYAEIKRLSQVVTVAREQPPCLFLLDEILHGTNSHDRRIGAEAILRALVAEGAVGLVTTHDLALARIAEDAALNAVNVHFQDHMEGGQMQFDYLLRSGVVEKSNALELMRAVGLEIPLDSAQETLTP